MLFHALFISPHLDDAVLSAGGEVARLTHDGKSACIVTVFTRAAAPVTRDAHGFIEESNEENAELLFSKRRLEDRKAAGVLGAHHVHMGFIDALFRTLPNKSEPLYPAYKQVFSGNISLNDRLLCEQIRVGLQKIKNRQTDKRVRIYAPLGVGGHVDHIITHLCVREIFPKQSIWWEDVPYRTHPIQLFKRLSEASCYNATNKLIKNTLQYSKQKLNAVRCYKSQIAKLEYSGLSDIDYYAEAYYTHVK